MAESPVGAKSFESALGELEKRVVKLEHGELDLDEALRLFEEGVGLVRQCQEILDQAEARVTTLGSGSDSPRPLSGSDG